MDVMHPSSFPSITRSIIFSTSQPLFYAPTFLLFGFFSPLVWFVPSLPSHLPNELTRHGPTAGSTWHAVRTTFIACLLHDCVYKAFCWTAFDVAF